MQTVSETSSFKSSGPIMVDTLERLRSISYFSESDWLEFLGISWNFHQKFKMGLAPLPDHCLDKICHLFKIEAQDLEKQNLNFKELAVRMENKDSAISDYYMVAPYSRRRTTITTIDYLEQAYGWKLKQDILEHFNIKESALLNPYASISIRFITEMCEYLKTRQFKQDDFVKMGLYSAVGNKNSLLGKTFLQMQSVQDILHYLINEMTPLFETNSTFLYTQISDTEGIMTAKSNPDIAHELNVQSVGSEATCWIKSGICASAPTYIGLPAAKVTLISCEHRGDDICRYHIDTSVCFQSQD